MRVEKRRIFIPGARIVDETTQAPASPAECCGDAPSPAQREASLCEVAEELSRALGRTSNLMAIANQFLFGVAARDSSGKDDGGATPLEQTLRGCLAAVQAQEDYLAEMCRRLRG